MATTYVTRETAPTRKKAENLVEETILDGTLADSGIDGDFKRDKSLI